MNVHFSRVLLVSSGLMDCYCIYYDCVPIPVLMRIHHPSETHTCPVRLFPLGKKIHLLQTIADDKVVA